MFSLESYLADDKPRRNVKLEDIKIPEEEFCFESYDMQQEAFKITRLEKSLGYLKEYQQKEEPSDLDLETLSVRLQMQGFDTACLSNDVIDRLVNAIALEKEGVVGRFAKRIKNGFNKLFNKAKHQMDACDDLLEVIRDLSDATLGEDKDVTADLSLGVKGKVSPAGLAMSLSNSIDYYSRRDTKLASAMKALNDNPDGSNAFEALSKETKFVFVEKNSAGYLSFVEGQNLFIAAEMTDEGAGVKDMKITEAEGDVESPVFSLKELESLIKDLRELAEIKYKSLKSLDKFSAEANRGIDGDIPQATQHFLNLFSIDGMLNTMNNRIIDNGIKFVRDCGKKYKK